MIINSIRTLVEYIRGNRQQEVRRFLIGDAVYGAPSYGTVIHPDEFERMGNTHIKNKGDLLKGIEVCLELSNGRLEICQAEFLTKVDPYEEIEKLRRREKNGALTEEYFLESIMFLSRVAERAFDFEAYQRTRY